MKKFRLIFVAALAACVVSSVCFAESIEERTDDLTAKQLEKAQMLYDLGLFRGTDKGFELEKTMTRGEAAVMITRLLGAESEALTKNYKSPFTDVPTWCAPHVGYLYQNKLTNGVSATKYGTAQNISFEQYAILLNRNVWAGVKDIEMYDYWVEHGCYTVSKEEFAKNADLTFLRGTAASLSARYLSIDSANVTTTVAEELIKKGAITTQALEQYARPITGSTIEKKIDGYVVRCILGVEIERSVRNDYIDAVNFFDGIGLAIRQENNELLVCRLSENKLKEISVLNLGVQREYSPSLFYIGESNNFSYAMCGIYGYEHCIIRYNSRETSVAIANLNGYAGECIANEFMIITSEGATHTINKITDICTKISDEEAIALFADGDKILFLPNRNSTREGFTSGSSEIKSVDAQGNVKIILSNDPKHGIPISSLTEVKDGMVYFRASFGNVDKNGFAYNYHYDGTRIFLDSLSYSQFAESTGLDYAKRETIIKSERERLDAIYK